MSETEQSIRRSNENQRHTHRPTFRSVAAFGMIAALIIGVVAAMLAVGVGLRDAAIIMNIAQPFTPLSPGSSESFGTVARLWTALTQHTFLPPLTAAVVLFVCAYLLRKVVLHGLRD